MRAWNVLFLCTGNSARSILAEMTLNHLGGGRFRAFSAGSQPSGKVRPEALRLLEAEGIDAAGARSKSWDEFAVEGAPVMDAIVTVCGSAAKEVCPVWLGHPTTAHWGVEDPAAVVGSEAEIAVAFDVAYRRLRSRIERFVALPVETMSKEELQREMEGIGQA